MRSAAAKDHPLLPMFAEIVRRGDDLIVRPAKPVASMTPKQAASFLGLSKRTVYYFCLPEVGIFTIERPSPRSIRIPIDQVTAQKKKTEDPEYWNTPEGQRCKQAIERARKREPAEGRK